MSESGQVLVDRVGKQRANVVIGYLVKVTLAGLTSSSITGLAIKLFVLIFGKGPNGR